jgi:hypothetical protein
VFAEPLANNGCLCWLHNSGFQQTHLNIIEMKLNLNHLHNSMIHIAGFGKDNAGVTKLDAMPQGDAMLSHYSLVSYWFTLLFK